MAVVGVASGIGAPDGRCSGGPSAVRRWLEAASIPGLAWRAMLEPETGPDRYRRLAHLAARLEETVVAAMQGGALPVVIGGDHSCAVGSWRGVARALRWRGPIGLIWVDAHMDSHTPETSPHGFPHGMPVAALLGQGHPAWIGAEGATLAPAHLCLVGVRSFEPAEAALLDRLGVKVFDIAAVRRIGLTEVMAQAREIVSAGTAGYGISIDLDSLDPSDAPGVGSPVVGGLHAAELLAALQPLAADPQLVALEIAELNPVIDEEHRTEALVRRLLALFAAECLAVA